MRITNKMVTVQTFSNINTNKTELDKLNHQMSTEKKLNRLSDDPVVGIRALRLRSNLSEVTQYYGANVPDAVAWVDVTQKAIDSTVDLLSNMRSLCDQGANGTNDAASRLKIYEDLKAGVKQIYQNGNANYAGRSVFAGYRTGEALTFNTDTTADYRGIKDTFNASDIKINSYVETPLDIEDINSLNGTVKETDVKEDRVNRIRLSYDNLNATVKKTDIGFTGTELANVAGFKDGTYRWDEYVDDGKLNDDGKNFSCTITIPNAETDPTIIIRIDPKCDQTMIFQPDPLHQVKETVSASVTGDADEMKVEVDGLVYTVTKDGSGYTVDKDAAVKQDGGNLILSIPNDSADVYKKITVKADGTAVEKAEKLTRINEMAMKAKPECLYYGGKEVGGNVYGTRREDKTTLVYRTELPTQASIPPGSVVTDSEGGPSYFEIKYGTETIRIQKYKDPDCDRYFAVDTSSDPPEPIPNIGVTRHTDGTFTIMVADDPAVKCGYEDHDCDVFNVSANGRTILSSYRQTALEVQITDSHSPVVTDSEGNDLTAYQYLSLDPNDKNETRPEAADKIYLLADTGELVFGSNVADILSSLKDIEGVDTISVAYDKSSFEEGDLRPEHYFDCDERNDERMMFDPLVYDDYDQAIYYSVGTDQKIQINTNAQDLFDTQIIREADDILNAIEGYNAAEEKVNRLKAMKEDTSAYSEADQEKISNLLDAANKELDIARNKLQSVYERGISSFGYFHDQANQASTDCGTVDNRLTLISNRLQEEKSTVTTMASENENVDITNVAVKVKEAELIYNAALMATGKISQHSLLNYI